MCLQRTIQLQEKCSWPGTEEHVSEVMRAVFCPLVRRNAQEVNLKGERCVLGRLEGFRMRLSLRVKGETCVR